MSGVFDDEIAVSRCFEDVLTNTGQAQQRGTYEKELKAKAGMGESTRESPAEVPVAELIRRYQQMLEQRMDAKVR